MLLGVDVTLSTMDSSSVSRLRNYNANSQPCVEQPIVTGLKLSLAPRCTWEVNLSFLLSATSDVTSRDTVEPIEDVESATWLCSSPRMKVRTLAIFVDQGKGRKSRPRLIEAVLDGAKHMNI